MSHFAVITPPFFSHARALQALAQALIKRGHRITFVQQADVASLLDDPHIAFQATGLTSHPPGRLKQTLHKAAHSTGLLLWQLINDMAENTDMLCRELPAVLNALAVDGVIVDQMAPAGGLVAEALQLPFVSVACALPVNREPHFPLPVMPFRYGTDSAARERFASSEKLFDWLMRRHDRVLTQHATALGLTPYRKPHELLSPLAQISQLPSVLDFPRRALPAWFHAVGPLRPDPADNRQAAPLFSATSQPRIFASLGTLQGQRYGLFKTLSKACREIDAQLLISHCGCLSESNVKRLLQAGAARVSDFVDQPSALAQADLAISHGGLNTVLDALYYQAPLLTIPLAFDQPGVAARLQFHGLAGRASRFSTSHHFARQLRKLLGDDAIKRRIAALRPALSTGGAASAAAITERALNTGRPVLAEHAYDYAV